MATILTLHGPNLNMLGRREPEIYGHDTLESIDAQLQSQAEVAGHDLITFQSNSEEGLITRIHQALDEGVAMIIINPAAYTHTSVAILDALLATKIPFIEVHLSNIHARETFRHHSYFSAHAMAVICGAGALSYSLALTAVLSQLEQSPHGHS